MVRFTRNPQEGPSDAGGASDAVPRPSSLCRHPSGDGAPAVAGWHLAGRGRADAGRRRQEIRQQHLANRREPGRKREPAGPADPQRRRRGRSGLPARWLPAVCLKAAGTTRRARGRRRCGRGQNRGQGQGQGCSLAAARGRRRGQQDRRSARRRRRAGRRQRCQVRYLLLARAAGHQRRGRGRGAPQGARGRGRDRDPARGGPGPVLGSRPWPGQPAAAGGGDSRARSGIGR